MFTTWLARSLILNSCHKVCQYCVLMRVTKIIVSVYCYIIEDTGTQELFLAVLTKTELVLYAKGIKSTPE